MKERTDGMIYSGRLKADHVGKQFIVMNNADGDFPQGTVISLVQTGATALDGLSKATHRLMQTETAMYDDVLLLPVEGLDITAPTEDAEPDDFSINELTEQYVQIDLNEVAELIVARETVYCDEGKHAVDKNTELASLNSFGEDSTYIAESLGGLFLYTDFYKKVTA